MTPKNRPTTRLLACVACSAVMLLVLSGCLEQVQSARLPNGALSNFFLHLYAGELDDARTYFAPGLVTPSPELDNSIQTAANRLRRYEIERKKTREEDLPNGEKQVTLAGRWRLRPAKGQPTPAPDSGWQEGDIITGRMIERGPGWRLLTFEVKCC